MIGFFSEDEYTIKKPSKYDLKHNHEKQFHSSGSGKDLN
jgi:hypothetical protein